MKLIADSIPDVFGRITPPDPLKPFLKDVSGSAGISLFFNNLIILIYEIAMVVFVFMVLWSGLEWILSGGDKEKLTAAQRRLTTAIVGIVILAVAFAILSLIGTFTGFSFFIDK